MPFIALMRTVAVALCAVCVLSCAPTNVPTAVPTSSAARSDIPAGFPEASYLRSAHPVLRIDSRSSLVTIIVRRDGPFARLGHDHVIASRDVAGYADLQAGRADLYVPLERLTVDEPGLRAQAGLDTHPTEDDIAGTRRNMLTKVLEADRYPFALIHAERSESNPARLRVAITLHGTMRSFDVPVRMAQEDDALSASGSLVLNQTDFGITPMSVLGGAIRVRDRLELQFRVVAARTGS